MSAIYPILGFCNLPLLEERYETEVGSYKIISVYRDIFNAITKIELNGIFILFFTKYFLGKLRLRIFVPRDIGTREPLWQIFNQLRKKLPHFLYTFPSESDYYAETVREIYSELGLSSEQQLKVLYQLLQCLLALKAHTGNSWHITQELQIIKVDPMRIHYPQGDLETKYLLVLSPTSENFHFGEKDHMQPLTALNKFKSIIRNYKPPFTYTHLEEILRPQLLLPATVEPPSEPVALPVNQEYVLRDYLDYYQARIQTSLVNNHALGRAWKESFDVKQAVIRAKLLIEVLNDEAALPVLEQYSKLLTSLDIEVPKELLQEINDLIQNLTYSRDKLNKQFGGHKEHNDDQKFALIMVTLNRRIREAESNSNY